MNNKNKKLNKEILDSTFYILGSERKGFTIVELLVSIGLFSVIVSIAMGGFVRALRTQRQIVALINANSNISLVVEQISREIRTGYNFPSVSGPQSSLDFTDAKGNNVTYNYQNLAQGGIITRKVNAGVELQITPDNVNIRYLYFTLLNEPLFPPRITINIGLSPTAASAPVVSENVTNIQTTISARSF